MDIENTLKKYIYKKFVRGKDRDMVGDDESLFERGIIDSLGLIQLVSFLEDRFKLQVEDEELIPDNFETVNQLKEYINEFEKSYVEVDNNIAKDTPNTDLIENNPYELLKYKIRNSNNKYIRIIDPNIISMIGDTATPVEISRRLFRKHHSITEILNRMERQGLLKKTKDLNKKNMVRVTLTEKGLKLHHLAFKEICINKIISSLSKETRRQLRSSLLLLRDRAITECGSNKIPPFPSSNKETRFLKFT